MKILYLDLGMGAAGDMLAGALLDLLEPTERAAFLEKLNALLPEGVTAMPARSCSACPRYEARMRHVPDGDVGTVNDRVSPVPGFVQTGVPSGERSV